MVACMSLKKNLTFRIFYYFRTGHSQYFLFVLWFIQFSTIMFLANWDYAFIFSILLFVYFPMATIAGYLHFKTQFKEEQRVVLRNSPVYQDIFRLLNKINEKLEEKSMNVYLIEKLVINTDSIHSVTAEYEKKGYTTDWYKANKFINDTNVVNTILGQKKLWLVTKLEKFEE